MPDTAEDKERTDVFKNGWFVVKKGEIDGEVKSMEVVKEND